MKKINRRTFITSSAMAGMASLITSNSFSNINVPAGTIKNLDITDMGANFNFNKNSKFKILQITDTHYIAGNPKSIRALDNVNQMLDLEKPDLVIHTGDLIYGKPAEKSAREILAPISERKIPFFVTFGNHDEEFDKTRNEMLDVIMSIPFNLNKKIPNIHGVTNGILTLSSANDNKVQRVLYIFDSNAYSKINGIKGYDHIRFDQIAWYRKNSEEFTKLNGNIPIPSLAFFHIPLLEHKEAINDDVNSETRGTKAELIASSKISSGLFASMKEMKDIQAMFVGHDHNNDCSTLWNKMFFIFGRFSGCDTVYNDLKPNGARVIELTENESSFRSWTRLFGGKIEQDLKYPDDFIKK